MPSIRSVADALSSPPDIRASPGRSSQARQFVRDPKRARPTHGLNGSLGLRAKLPADARPTGYRHDAFVELYLAPSAQGSVNR
jgi:hypothetical protein